jgi:hypothetical protein
MTWVATAIVGSAVIGGYSANKAAKTQARSAAEATAAQERMFNRQVELQEPFRQAGVNALPELIAASRYQPFGMEQFQQDPGYVFRVKEGLRALENRAAAAGTRVSGNQLRGVVRYGQELASQDWMNSFNRFQAERAARLNPLQSLAGMGQTTAANVAGQVGQFGQAMGANIIGAGNARASGYMGTANALSNALGQGLNYYQNQQLMARMFPQQGGGAMNPAYPAGIYNPTDLA